MTPSSAANGQSTTMRGHQYTSVIITLTLLWVWLSILHPAQAVLTCGSCEGGSSLACPDSLDMQFSVSLYPYRNELNRSLRLKCDYFTKTLNFTLLEGCSFPDVVYVKIEQCPLFEESLGSVLIKIGIDVSKVRSFRWEVSHSVENGLQTWHLEGLRNLTYLQIQDNKFKSFPDQFLKGTPLLRKLYVSGNYISELPVDFLSYTPELTVLDLGNNHLQMIPENLLENLSSLDILNLWTNEITAIPIKLFVGTPLLTTIVISSNKLTEVAPRLFADLGHLENVDIQINQLRTLPENIFEGCVNLSVISLQHNQISYLPRNIFRGTSLTILNLGYNELSDMNEALNNITSLQNVTLHKNSFETLNEGLFRGSPNIVRLDLQANYIETLAEGIFRNLSRLRIILLNSNLLDEIPQALFRNCISLKRIFMQENNISVIPANTFPDFSDIVKLDLSNNRLYFPEDLLYNPLNKLTGLEELYLSGNRITTLFNEVLYVFTRLRILDLRNNLIDTLTERELTFISKNVTLFLQDNNISRILVSAVLGTGSNDKYLSLSLAGNSLACDCKLYSFLKIAQLRRPFSLNLPYNLIVEDADNTFCSEPYDYQNISLVDVDATKVVCEYNCSEECPCNIRLHDTFILMDCSNRGMSESPTFTRQFEMVKKRFNLSLDLSNNNFEDVSFLSDSEYENLVNLDLANNTVEYLNETYLPDSLRYLDLSSNNFTSMPKDLLDYLNSSGMNLHLGGNPWSCDCSLKSFQEFLRDNYELVLDRARVLCRDGGAPVDQLSAEQLCSVRIQPTTVASIAAGVVLILLVAVLVTAAWYRHKEMLKVWLYSRNLCLWAVTEHEIDADKKYDAFISYSYKDEGFINNILVPGLESGDPKYRVCLHYRDWIPGGYIQDQILTSVKASRRTIVVLSKNFTESVWGQLEFKAAHSQALKDKTNRIIIIIYGEVPKDEELDDEMKLYIATNTYLKWGDQRFWERLRYAMPHSKYTRHTKKSQVDKLELVKPASNSAAKTVDD